MNKKNFTHFCLALLFGLSIFTFACQCCSGKPIMPEKQNKQASSSKKCCQNENKQEENKDTNNHDNNSKKKCNCKHFLTSKIHTKARVSEAFSPDCLRNLTVSSIEAIKSNDECSMKNKSSNSPPLILNLTISTTVLLI